MAENATELVSGVLDRVAGRPVYLEDGQQRLFRLDPRTKIFALIVVNILVMGSSPMSIVICCAILTASLLSSLRSVKTLLIFLVVFMACALWCTYGAWLWESMCNAVLIAVCFWVCRMSVSFALATFVIKSTGAAEFSSALRALRVPKSLVTVATVVLRFIPLVGAELRAIIAAMRLRGIYNGPGSLFTHPLRMAEHIMVPMLAAVTRLIDDLSASGITRGLGSAKVPTSLVRIRFGINDAIVLIITAAIILLNAAGFPL